METSGKNHYIGFVKEALDALGTWVMEFDFMEYI